MSFKITFNDKEIGQVMSNLKAKVEERIQKAVQNAALATHAKAIELAGDRLHTRQKEFFENLSFDEISPNLYVVSLAGKAAWIEDGVKGPYDMRDTLLKKGFKVSKDGFRYRSIPFDQAKSPSQLNTKGKEMVDLVKRELKNRNIPFKKIEYNADGSPKLGKLHQMNIDSPRPSANAKFPQLSGLAIYQSIPKGSKSVRRDIMTFRTISDKNRGQSWINPGVEPTDIMKDTFDWLVDHFQTEVLPNLLKDL